MNYNVSFSIFICFCITLQSLYAMESSRAIINRPIIVDTIEKIDGKGVYCAYYGQDNNTLIALTKQGCYIRKIKEKHDKKISDSGWCDDMDTFSACYKKIGISLDGKKVIIAKKNTLEICDINTNKISREEMSSSSIYSIFCDQKNDSRFILISGQDNLFLLQKYSYDENCKFHNLDGFDICKTRDFNFMINRLICIAYKIDYMTDTAKINLYNSDLELRQGYHVPELLKLID